MLNAISTLVNIAFKVTIMLVVFATFGILDITDAIDAIDTDF